MRPQPFEMSPNIQLDANPLRLKLSSDTHFYVAYANKQRVYHQHNTQLTK